MKLVKESIGDVLKPKSEEDVMKDFYDITPSHFPVLQMEFRKKFGKPIPTEYCPLIVQIYRDMSVSSKFDDMETISKLYVQGVGSFGTSLCFDIHGKRREIWVKQSDDISYVMFKIHPFVKVRELKHIIVANNYIIKTFDQYKILSEKISEKL